VVFITHKLNEALDLGDRITVLRRGRNAGELAPDKIASTERGDLKDLVVELIFGAVDPDMSMNQGEGGSLDQQSVCFRLEEVSLHGDKPWPVLDSVSLEIRRGEIFGIAGIDGNGQKELAEVIAGQRKLDSGEIFLDEESVTGLSVAARQKRGIRYVTDDRHGEGTVGELSISLNTVLKRVGQRPFWRRARVRHSLIREFAATLVAEHDVRTPHEEVPSANLSGGNVQKVVVGRELAMEPRVVVYNKPTYGLDVKTIKAVLARIVSQANQGTVALLISTELDELISTCDRIGVMYQGRITGILDSQPGIETRLGEMMTGGGEPA
jgi:simple sugar transport system ATP-binding protein